MKKKRFKFDLNMVNIVLLVLLLISMIAFGAQLFTKLPLELLLVIILVFLLICVLLRLLAIRKNPTVKKTAVVLTLIMLVIFNFGNYYVLRTNMALGTIGGANVDIIEYSLVVKNDSPIQTVEDIASDSKFEILELGDTEFNQDAVNKVGEEIGATVDPLKTASFEKAYNNLMDGESDVLILNEGLRPMFSENDLDLDNNTRVITKYQFERERNTTSDITDITKESFIVYISGIDIYGSISLVSRSDVNKLMAVNPNTKEILLIDIPRDYYIEQTCQGNQLDKLTHTGIFGVDCTVDSVGNFFDIDVDYYARVNFSSLINIVDALGGIEVNSEYAFCSGQYCYDKGINYLNGDEALMFSRERYSLPNGDNDRIKNQTRVLEGIIKKATSPAILTNYLSFMDVLSKSVETNMSSSDIDKLIQMQLKDMSGWKISSYSVTGTGATEYSPANGFNSYVMWPNDTSVAEARSMLTEMMFKK